MENFSYVWIFIIFLCQMLGTGIYMAKLGVPRTGTYSGIDLVVNIIFCILTGLSLYWWK